MNERDRVLKRLEELPVPALDPALFARIQAQAARRLESRRLSPIWTVALSLSVVTYLYWALTFTGSLLAAR